MASKKDKAAGIKPATEAELRRIAKETKKLEAEAKKRKAVVAAAAAEKATGKPKPVADEPLFDSGTLGKFGKFEDADWQDQRAAHQRATLRAPGRPKAKISRDQMLEAAAKRDKRSGRK